MDRDETGTDAARGRGPSGASGVAGAPKAMANATKVKAKAGAGVSGADPRVPAPPQGATGFQSADPGAKPRLKARAKPKPKPEPEVVVIKRLRRDERFYIGGQECETREQLIASFARSLHFPEWTPSWESFERCMLDLTWLATPWPPRRACVLEMHDADYLLARGSDSDLVAFFTIIERARRHSRLPFRFEGLVRKEAPMRRIQAAISAAMSDLGLEDAAEARGR